MIREVIQQALNKGSIDTDDVQWTEMRWDVPDVSAAWPKRELRRNVHAWVTGDWPSYSLFIEGALWRDNEKERRRTVTFVPFDRAPAGTITVSGSTADPRLTISKEEDLVKDLAGFVLKLKNAELDSSDWAVKTTSELQPRPDFQVPR